MIPVVVNNHQDEHQSTMLKTSSMISDQQLCILIDRGANESFISSIALKISKVKEVEQDKLRYVELASRAKKKVGQKVKYCKINLGDFVASVNVFLKLGIL